VHEVLFGSPAETVTLIHESVSREAFGRGVLFAAEHMQGKPPGLYTMEDLLLSSCRGLGETERDGEAEYAVSESGDGLRTFHETAREERGS
jgi:hypothetical protein